MGRLPAQPANKLVSLHLVPTRRHDRRRLHACPWRPFHATRLFAGLSLRTQNLTAVFLAVRLVCRCSPSPRPLCVHPVVQRTPPPLNKASLSALNDSGVMECAASSWSTMHTHCSTC